MQPLTTGSREWALVRCRVAIDDIFPVGAMGLFVMGWIAGAGEHVRELWIGPETEGYDVLRNAYRYPRPDILAGLDSDPYVRYEDAGFMVFIPDGMLRLRERRLAVICDNEILYHLDIRKMPAAGMRPLETAKRLLRHVDIQSSRIRELMDRQIGPALTMLDWPTSVATTPEVREYGLVPKRPAVSVIVPLYGRLDLMEYQLSQFGIDKQFCAEVELIYVLDDPKLLDSFRMFCHVIAPLYGTPFKALTYSTNLGYAGANNVGARAARGKYLILLNSDVLPSNTGWVHQMLTNYQQISDCGALGVRLLFPDGSIQHDGMRFERFPPWGNLWINTHPRKRLPVPQTEELPRLEPMPAVTSACLLISRDDFLVTVQGFDEGYIIGDFEDSDLCLKLLMKERLSYIIRDVTLYHLERQSQSLIDESDWKLKLTLFNCWRHTNRWDSLISHLSGETT